MASALVKIALVALLIIVLQPFAVAALVLVVSLGMLWLLLRLLTRL